MGWLRICRANAGGERADEQGLGQLLEVGSPKNERRHSGAVRGMCGREREHRLLQMRRPLRRHLPSPPRTGIALCSCQSLAKRPLWGDEPGT